MQFVFLTLPGDMTQRNYFLEFVDLHNRIIIFSLFSQFEFVQNWFKSKHMVTEDRKEASPMSTPTYAKINIKEFP